MWLLDHIGKRMEVTVAPDSGIEQQPPSVSDGIPAPSHEVLKQSPWRNPAVWERWSSRKILGNETSFDHLWPFDLKLTKAAHGDLPAMLVNIRVVFDCHVVTKSRDDEVHQSVTEVEQHWKDSGENVRVFHQRRYDLSKELPKMITDMVQVVSSGFCFGAAKSNYMICKPQGWTEDGPDYQVFFDLYRTDEPEPRLVLYVQSAYERQLTSRCREKRMRFATVCADLMGLIPAKSKSKKKKGSKPRAEKNKSPA